MPNLYPFDPPYIDVSFNAKPGADEPVLVWHRMRKPTAEEILNATRQVKIAFREINSREEEIAVDDEAANCGLWDQIIQSVKGYRGMDEWTTLTDDQKATMRAPHKIAAIRSMNVATYRVLNEGDGVGLGGDTWEIEQIIGRDVEAPDFLIIHTLREPTESERSQFRRRASRTSIVKGMKRQETKVSTDLGAYIALYDALVQRVDGGTVDERGWDKSERPQFISAIDPNMKRGVIQKLMESIEAALSD